MEAIIVENLSPTESLALVRKVYLKPSPYPHLLYTLSLILLTVVAVFIFGGTGREALVAFLLSLVITLIHRRLIPEHIVAERGKEIIYGFIASLGAVLWARYIYSIDFFSTVFGCIVWSLPGLKLTLAVTDISMGHVITGSATFIGAIFTTVTLAIGILIGEAIDSPEQLQLDFGELQSIPWQIWVATTIYTFPLLVVLDAPPRHSFYLAGVSLAGFAIATAIAVSYRKEYAYFLAAFVVGMISNLYDRITSNPAIEMDLFSITLLAPGALGVAAGGLNSSADSAAAFITLITIAVALVTGILSANILFRPTRYIRLYSNHVV